MALQSVMLPFALHRQAYLPSPAKLSANFGSSSVKSSSIHCCVAKSTIKADQEGPPVTRRSANYPASCWDYSFIQSLDSDFTEEKYKKKANQLKDEVRHLIRSDIAPLAKLELIDSIQRLGLKYQFSTEIKEELDLLYREKHSGPLSYNGHHATSLAFRLFRQHGFEVPAETFCKFKDERGKFKESLRDDWKGLLNLYEASFFGLEGETIIDEARIFATKHLKEIMNGNVSPGVVKMIGHALGMPLHWTLQRVEARWYIETCQRDHQLTNPILLEFAKLDYNMVQSVHQQEVVRLAKWWVDTGLSKITFARDRLVEHYFWCCGIIFEPKYGEFRKRATKIISLITTIDDVYDVYGTLDELEVVTDFVDRWDMNGIDDKLPHNIKACVLAMYNNMNEIGHWFQKERGINIIPSLSKAWGDLCKAYLIEAKWYHSGYKPTLEEYLANAVISVAGPLMLFSAYFMTTDKLREEDCHKLLGNLPGIMYLSSIILRLTDDLGTSSIELARGDNLKAVECYMYEAGVSEEVATKHIEDLVRESWKAMNKELMAAEVNYSIREPFLSANPNLGRTSHCFYQFGDGHGFPYHSTKDHITNLLVNPFPLDNQ